MRVNTRETPVALPTKPMLTEQGGKLHSTVVGGSTAGIRLNCNASRVEEQKAHRDTNVYADRGTALHHVVERAINEDLTDVEVLRQFTGVAVKLDDMVHTIDLTAELLSAKVLPALAYLDDVVPRKAKLHVESKLGLFIPADKPHRFGAAMGEHGFETVEGAFGTGDIVADEMAAPGDRWLPGVLDWKFGDGIMVSAEDNDQMRFYLVGAIMHGWLPVVPEYVAHIFQPADSRQPEEYGSMAVYSLDDLVRFSRDLAAAIDGPVVYNPGPWCARCKGKLTCGPYNDMLTMAVNTDIPGMTAKQLAQMLRLVPAFTKFIEDVKAAALRNAQQGVDIPGFKLEPALGNSAWRDEDKAWTALGRMGLAADVRTVKKTISPTQAVKELGKLGTEKKALERFTKTHIHRPENGEKLVPAKTEEEALGAVKRLAKVLKARGH
jgi:hypothetical protein